MGLCFPCPGDSAPPTPDPAEKRAKLAEAAERRQKEAASRGILDVQSVEEKRKKKEKIEKQIATSGPPPAGGLRTSEVDGEEEESKNGFLELYSFYSLCGN
ncbi:small VCP/p97-interacting protein isoform X1 [Marmota marmota marmota]|uniref:small VCP/p97-interacting protein isoform X1 n=1 Tax=Marmota marmota marmota TaxID=9994 RepID=UPI0020930C5E|nr:small VCP/p97-interacting protein isoform X1 [Marmota marmota marmota]